MRRKTANILTLRKGFSLIEMLIATVLILIVSGSAYRILSQQGLLQKASVFGQKQNSRMISALDRFKNDMTKIDSQWPKMGVACVFPHQGLGLGNNFYVDMTIQSEGLNDGLTMLRRNPEKAALNTLNQDITTTTLYSSWIPLKESTTQLTRGDWVLLFQPGTYALGIVTRISTLGSNAQIRIRQPNPNEMEQTYLNTTNNASTGYVLKSGVVPGNYDWTGIATLSPDDNVLALKKDITKIQPLDFPVSYELDWVTSDGQPKSSTNVYVFNEDGSLRKAVVRTEYTSNGPKREYLAESNQLGFTYDALTPSAHSMTASGYTDGDIAKDIGRDAFSQFHFVDLQMSPTDSYEGFISTSKIVSVNMMLGGNLKQDGSQNEKFNELHVAIDPSLQKDRYQDSGQSFVKHSDDLATTAGFLGTQMGQPLYMKYANSNDVHVLTPINHLTTSTGASGGFQNGKLVVMNDSGCPVNSATCDAEDPSSEITFQSQSTGPNSNSYFYPTTMVQTADGSTNKVLIGGFSINVDTSTSPPGITRTLATAKIEFPANKTLQDVLGNPSTDPSSLCSVAGCTLQYINPGTAVTSGSSTRLQDTAGGFSVDESTGDVYVTSMTKGTRNDSTLAIYKTDANLSTFEEKIVDTSGIATNRVTTAVAQSPIEVGGSKYLPICESRSISSGTTPTEDGGVYLYNLSTPSAPIQIAQHNFRCTSLQSVNGNLLIGGKLINQVEKKEVIDSIVAGATTTVPMIYTDEVAYEETSGVKNYADGYYRTMSAPGGTALRAALPVFGWNTGLSVQKTSKTNFSVVLGNRTMINTSSGNTDQQDFTIINVNMGGMENRVLATIKTNFNNLNESDVSAKYNEDQMVMPDVLLPGHFYTPDTPRQTLAAIPLLKPNMTEANWFDFAMDYIDIKDRAVATPHVFLPNPANIRLLPTSTRTGVVSEEQLAVTR